MLLATLSTTTAVLLSAGIGVLGAVLGATASGIGTYKIEAQRQAFEAQQALRRERRESDRQRAVMCGAARAWYRELGRYLSLIGVMGTHPHQGKEPVWWPDAAIDPLIPAVSAEDRKLIASAVTEDEWDQLVRAENTIHVVETLRRAERGDTRPEALGPALGDESKEAVAMALVRGAEAVIVLRKAAGAPTTVPDE
jgi:hypothetical protein